MSRKLLFNNSWFFKEFPLDTPFDEMNSSCLNPVELPHDWMIYHVKDLYKNSTGFYKKTFSISKNNDSVFFLFFEGVYMDSHVFINGKDIFEWKYGYSSFEVNISDYIVDGENEVAVTVRYEAPNSRWYSGAGIYRNVYLIEKSKTYFTDFGSYISTEKNDSDFIVYSDMGIFSDKKVSASVINEIFSPDSEIPVSSSKNSFSFSGLFTDRQKMSVNNPRLWDISDPFLYTFKSTLIIENTIVDTYSCNLGFRTIRFDKKTGFYLNNRNIKLNGACMHHDLGSLGAAMNKNALRRQFETLLEMGVNAIRTSHNMPAVEVMDLADEMGILIYSESFDMWELPKTPHDYANFFPKWWEKDVFNWIRRDCNHPSVIIWGIGNEIYDTHVGTGFKWAKLLRDYVAKLDYRHNGFIGIASNYIAWENAQKCSDLLDLSGYNYGEHLYNEHHEKYPHWCIFGSETGSTIQSRGIYHFPFESKLLTCEDGQCSSLGNCTTNWGSKDIDSAILHHKKRDFVFGQFIWTGWDYIGEPTPYFSKNSFFGAIDTAGFKKDAFFHYQAGWTELSENPMVHLLPYWDFNDGQIIDVCAYSNAPYVELFLNDKSLGKKYIDLENGPELQARWKVPYEKGEIKAVAYDNDFRVVATDTQKSFSDPSDIVLSTKNTRLKADGKDLCFIEISTVDSNGVFVANARNRMNISVSGCCRLVGLDNGDSTDYEEYKGTSRKLFSGRLLAIVESTYETGEAVIMVSSKGLKPASLKIMSEKIDCPIEKDYFEANTQSDFKDDVPVRKISLVNRGAVELTKDSPHTEVSFSLYPENSTFPEINIAALTKDGVPANFVDISKDGNLIRIHAFGDGVFKLTASANNGSDIHEILSELEFTASGMGPASHNAFELVPGIMADDCSSSEFKLSFLGGIFLPASEDNTSSITFNNIDFGEYSSDEITVPIFSFLDELGIEIFEGDISSGVSLCRDTYRAKSIYNTYQENTFKLNKRLHGTTSITLKFFTTDRISVQGFSFTKKENSYFNLFATEYSEICGDSFTVCEDMIKNIGNNVDISFNSMPFSEGISSVNIYGRSNNPTTSIHILFKTESGIIRQMVEIPHTDSYEEFVLPLSNVESCQAISFVFLPGSNFDFISFQFKK